MDLLPATLATRRCHCSLRARKRQYPLLKRVRRARSLRGTCGVLKYYEDVTFTFKKCTKSPLFEVPTIFVVTSPRNELYIIVSPEVLDHPPDPILLLGAEGAIGFRGKQRGEKNDYFEQSSSGFFFARMSSFPEYRLHLHAVGGYGYSASLFR